MKSNTRPLLCALLFLIKSADAAPSLILSDQPGWNGWSVQTRIKAGYREHGGAGEDAITDTQNTNISPFAVTAGSVISTPAASASKLPASGSAKDKAEGSLSFNYIVGGAATTDTFSVNMHATTSAMTSKHNFGGGLVAADAFVEGELVLTTYWPLTGAMLRIPAMPALTAAAPSTESMLALMDGGGAAGYMLPGFAELDYPLTLSAPPGSTVFTYTLTYSIVTPYGADPVVSYHLNGAASGPALPAPPQANAAEESVKQEMPVVKLNKLVYDHDDQLSARVCFKNASDIASHNLLVLVCPDTNEIEKLDLIPTADPLIFKTTPITIKTSGNPGSFDGTFTLPPGKMFTALYGYHLSNRISPDISKGIKPGNPFISSDYAMTYDPNFAGMVTLINPDMALSNDEENPDQGGRKLGTLAIEGRPGIVQIASEDLIFYPKSPEQEAEFAAKAHATKLSDDAEWKGQNGKAVWQRYGTIDDPAFNAERADRIRYLPQLLALTGISGKLHASNERVLALFATGLELWLEGYNCAVNPRIMPHGKLTAPEGRAFSSIDGTSVPDPFDSMTSEVNMFDPLDDAMFSLRYMWAEAGMQDCDTQTINMAFLDSSFAPNPDFRGYPNDIPQFNMDTGERGPHAAEHPEQPIPIRGPVWHGNGTVAVAAGVMGNGYGFAGVGGQVVQPMLYYMGTRSFAFEMGLGMELAVADGADIINISAGYPCRILSVLGPIRICSADERAAAAATISALVAASAGAVCSLGPVADIFLPGVGAIACGSAIAVASTAIGALFDALFISTAIGDPRHAMEAGVAAAKAAGVPVVASAGNQIDWSTQGDFAALFDTSNCRTDDWEQVPGVIPDVICVSSVAMREFYPNTQFHGPAVDLWAPEGQPVLMPEDFTLLNPSVIPVDEQKILRFTGSSASTPFVSGIIAHMMAVNPTMDPHRATAGQRATNVTRITNMLRSTATVPGSTPLLPATDPTNIEIGRRGLLVNAFLARATARDNAGIPPMDTGGYPLFQARFDHEAAVTNDDEEIARIQIPPSGSVNVLGGLPAGDLDTWYFRNPTPPANSFITTTLHVTVPNTLGPPTYLYIEGRPIPIASTTATETTYDFRLRGCEWQRVGLSCSAGRPRPDASPLRRPDVLYRITAGTPVLSTGSGVDAFEGGSGNNDFTHATTIPGSSWVPYTGPTNPFCSTDAKEVSRTGLTLSGCGDTDVFRILPWTGYVPGESRFSSVVAVLDPPIPGVRMQFFEEVLRDGIPHIEATAAIGDGGGGGVAINAYTHPLPLFLKIEGTSAASFSLKITYCDGNSALDAVINGASSARSGGNGWIDPMDFLRELRWVDISVPTTFTPDFPDDLVKFNWPRDLQGRSLRGQLFHITHTGGPLRLMAEPGHSAASGRFDFFDMNGFNLGGGATEDLIGSDDPGPYSSYHPQSLPISLETKSQPPGEYFLALSGFHLTDHWRLTLGENQTLPGYPTVENPGGSINKPLTIPMLIGDASFPFSPSAVSRLAGTPFAPHVLIGLSVKFPVKIGEPWRLEYSEDDETWTEASSASMPFVTGEDLSYAFPPPGGHFRIRRFWPRSVLPISSSLPAPYYAVPTALSRSYSTEFSEDLLNWLPSTPIPGDDAVLLRSMSIFGERGFYRTRRY